MTPKERAAMQQVICKINQVTAFDETGDELLFEAQEILRKALDHSGEANEMVGCAYCNNPLFAGTKCNNCWLVTLAEKAEQEPVAWCYFCEDALWGFFTDPDECDPDCDNEMPLYAAPVRTKDLTDDDLFEIANKVGFDGELMKMNHDRGMPSIAEQYARAVIASDRELNK